MHVFAAFLLNVFLTVLFSGLAVVFHDMIIGLIIQVLDMAVDSVNAVSGDFQIPTIQQAVNLLPLTVLQIMARLGFDECLAIIVTATTVRFAAGVLGVSRGFRAGTT